VLKIDLHTHTADDPCDHISYSTRELIDRASCLGFDALAITLHDKQLGIEELIPYASDRGIVLIRGIERTIEGKHVLLLNFRRGAEDVQSFADLARLKRREPGLVIAPHPFFPASSCLGDVMNRHVDLFDAVEYNGMFTASVNFNRAAERWGRMHDKPIVGNGDVHRLRQLGTTYSLVEAQRDADSICEAIARGQVRVEASPHSALTAAGLMADLVLSNVFARRRPLSRTSERQPTSGPATSIAVRTAM
jgi:predicted metal-dependent phosphoesterase TrpH